MKILNLLALFLYISFQVFAQEVLLPLQSNPALKNIKHSNKNKSLPRVYDSLPFIDDFSFTGNFPDYKRWIDQRVYINNDFPIEPVTIGVATFDALNEYGLIDAYASSSPYVSDYLTSIPIRLDSLFKKGIKSRPIRIKDSVFISFYYQPQGNGNEPQTLDKFILEFYSAKDNAWNQIWSDTGTSFTNFKNKYGVSFRKIRYVMKDSKDSVRYFNKNFQFRFKNYASIASNYIPSWASNSDQWNLDYVFLDIKSSDNDNQFRDLAFTKHKTTLLKNYQNMTWKQFQANAQNEMNSSIDFPYYNFSNNILNVERTFSITDLSKTVPIFYTEPKITVIGDMPAYSSNSYTPNLNGYIFDSKNPKYADFEVLAAINSKTIMDINKANDNVSFIQRFYNYYAYDDGNPEAGYGLSNIDGKIACRFTLNVPDTLQAIEIFFNSTYQNANSQYFNLCVWDDLSKNPIYIKKYLKPQDITHLNEFSIYSLDKPKFLTNTTYYIGVQQTTKDNLNIGFDKNTNSQSNIFINVSGTWTNTMYEGSLMIRPILGYDKLPYEGVTEIKNTATPILYPNPSRGDVLNINFQAKHKDNLKISIFNNLGKLVFAQEFNNKINLSELNTGIYLVRIYNNDDINFTQKLIINK